MLKKYVSIALALLMIFLSIPISGLAEINVSQSTILVEDEMIDEAIEDEDMEVEVFDDDENVLDTLRMNLKELRLKAGESEQLLTIASPSNAQMSDITWTSEDDSVAIVYEDGTVTAVAEGETEITAFMKIGEWEAACKVIVEPADALVPVESVSFHTKQLELIQGTTKSMEYVIAPENATDKTVTWASSDESVATVNEGVVKGIAEGKTTITVTTKDGNFTDSLEVSVNTVGDDTAILVFPKKGKLADLLKKAGFDPADAGQASRLKHIYITSAVDLDSKIELASSDMKNVVKFVNLESFIMEEGCLVGFKDNTLPNGAFQTMKNLKNVILPDVQVIGARSFGYVKGTEGSVESMACSSLEKAEFGQVRSIGCGAFYGCESLESFTFNGIASAPILEDDAEHPEEYAYWFELVPDGVKVYVPARAIDTFSGEENEDGEIEPTEWDRFEILSNGDDSEEGNDEAGTETVLIPTLGGKRISACKEITDYYGQGTGKKPYDAIGYLTIESGNLLASDFTFIKNNLVGLQELRIIGDTTMPSAKFDDYSKVEDMESDDASDIARQNAKDYQNVIPSNAFGMMNFLRYVEITNAQVVGKQAFQKIESLEEVILPNVQRINSMAFAMVKGSDKSKLEYLSIPKLEYMEHRTFYFCVNLTTLELGEKAPFVYRPQGKEGLWFSFVPGPVTISVPDRSAYDDFMDEKNCMLIDWSSFDFEARNGEELPIIEKALPYVDSDLDYLKETWESEDEYYTGDLKIGLNFYTFNVNLNASRDGKASPPPISTLDAMRWAKSVGFDAADITAYYIPGYSNTAMPTEEQKPEILQFAKEIKALSEELDLPLSGTGLQNNFADPSQKRRELDIERIKYWIDIADVMGAPCIRIFSGTPPADVGRSGWYKIMDERIVPAVQEVADYAAENYPDMMIGLQNHGDMLATANQVLYALDKIDRDNVRIVNDTGYYHDFMDLNTASIESYDWYSDIAQILPYSTNFQVKKKPAGAGTGPLMDLERIFTDIRNSSYCGYVPIELLWVSTEAGYPNYLNTPPYEETKEFFQMVKAAMEATKTTSPRCDIKDVLFPADANLNQADLKIKAVVDHQLFEVTPYLTISSGATWKLYGDESCRQEISSVQMTQDVVTAFIQVTAQAGQKKVYTLELTKGNRESDSGISVTEISLVADKERLYYNRSSESTANITASIQPENASGYRIAWQSSNPSVMTITGTGKNAIATAIAAGSTTITAVVINSDGSTITESLELIVGKWSSQSSGSGSESNSKDIKTETSNLHGDWKQEERGWRFLKADGTYAMSEWGMINGRWYYFNQDSDMETGWLLYNGSWYYLNVDGDMVEKNWSMVNGKWYCFYEGGTMAANSWILSGDKWYYVGSDGEMLVSVTTPDGYLVNENGEWVNK